MKTKTSQRWIFRKQKFFVRKFVLNLEFWIAVFKSRCLFSLLIYVSSLWQRSSLFFASQLFTLVMDIRDLYVPIISNSGIIFLKSSILIAAFQSNSMLEGYLKFNFQNPYRVPWVSVFEKKYCFNSLTYKVFFFFNLNGH